jgi:hypothetical protein
MRRVFASRLPGDAELARSLLANYGIEVKDLHGNVLTVTKSTKVVFRAAGTAVPRRTREMSKRYANSVGKSPSTNAQMEAELCV